MLIRYCEMYARWVAASKVLQREGDTYEVRTATGTRVYRRPEVEIAAQLDAAMRKTEAEFGMSPSSRTRIEARPPEKDEKSDDKAKFFGVVG